MFDAFLGDVPEGDFDVDEYAKKFVGKFAMCKTFEDTYNGQSRTKPSEFWMSDDAGAGGEEEEEEVDLDDFSDDDIKKVGKAMGIKSKRASTIRKELEDADPDKLMGVLEDLGLAGEEEEEEEAEGEALDLDELTDDQIKALAKAAGLTVTAKARANTLKKKLAAMDEDELAEAAEEAGITGGGEEGAELEAEAIAAMNQEELEELVEEHDLDVDLDKFSTLRKKRVAVIDAAVEAELIAED
jgi:hypothetical protein